MSQPYPIPVGSDTGALQDIPRDAIALAKSQPVISGVVLGALVGRYALKKKTLLGAILGAIGGYYVRSQNV